MFSFDRMIAGLVGQRHVQGDEVGAVKQLIQFHLGHAHRLRALLAQERVVGHDLHMQPQRPVADDAADIAGADHAEGLVEQLDPHEAVLLPLARMGGFGGFRQLPRHREHHRNRVLGRGDGVAEGRIHHDHALFGRGRDIDIVDPDTGAADDLEPGRRFQHLFCNLGRGADCKAVILPDHFEELILVSAKIGQVVDLDPPVAEYLDSGFRQFVGDENFGCHFKRLLEFREIEGRFWGGLRPLPPAPRFRPRKPIRSRASAPRHRRSRRSSRTRSRKPAGASR